MRWAFCSTTNRVCPADGQPPDEGEHQVHERGGQPEGGLVHEQDPGGAHEGAGDGQLLGLTAGEVAGGRVAPIAQHGEQLGHLLEALGAPAGGGGDPRHEQVLTHGEVGEQPAVLGDEGDAGAQHPVRWGARDVGALQQDAAGRGIQQAGHGSSAAWSCPLRWGR